MHMSHKTKPNLRSRLKVKSDTKFVEVHFNVKHISFVPQRENNTSDSRALKLC